MVAYRRLQQLLILNDPSPSNVVQGTTNAVRVPSSPSSFCLTDSRTCLPSRCLQLQEEDFIHYHAPFVSASHYASDVTAFATAIVSQLPAGPPVCITLPPGESVELSHEEAVALAERLSHLPIAALCQTVRFDRLNSR